MSNTRVMPRAIGFVRAWVLLYTAGLPPGLRDSRREEIDADLWEQAKEAETGLSDGLPLATHLLLRWLLGLPDDLLWRLAHIRTKDADTKEGSMVQARDYKTLTVVTGVVAALLLIALVIYVVATEVAFQRQTESPFDWVYIAATFGPVSLAAITGGFWSMRKAPMLGAVLVTSGSMAFAIFLYWLIIPVVLGIGLSFYAIRRARRIQAGE